MVFLIQTTKILDMKKRHMHNARIRFLKIKPRNTEFKPNLYNLDIWVKILYTHPTFFFFNNKYKIVLLVELNESLESTYICFMKRFVIKRIVKSHLNE